MSNAKIDTIKKYIALLTNSQERLTNKIAIYEAKISELYSQKRNHEASQKQDDMIDIIRQKRDIKNEISKQEYLLSEELKKIQT